MYVVLVAVEFVEGVELFVVFMKTTVLDRRLVDRIGEAGGRRGVGGERTFRAAFKGPLPVTAMKCNGKAVVSRNFSRSRRQGPLNSVIDHVRGANSDTSNRVISIPAST